MVRSIRLRNFRSYKTGKIELCSGINGIIGNPQSGKTNIIRAIKLLVFNRPGGFSYIRNRSKALSTTIRIKVDNYKYPITLKKSKKETFYQIGEARFEKFGKSVPENISRILNLSDINFHEQLESPFLITSRPSEVSQAINEVTGITDFDLWISAVNEKIKDLKKEESFNETARANAQAALSKLEGIEEIEIIFKRLKETEKALIRESRRYEIASEKLAFVKDLQKRIRREKNITDLDEDLNKIKIIRTKIEQTKDKIEKIKKVFHLKEILVEAKKRHNDFLKEFILLIKRAKKCPTCFGRINRINITRIKNEFSLDK